MKTMTEQAARFDSWRGKLPPFAYPEAGDGTIDIGWNADAALEQLVPPDLLARADKILFVAHLALGDFTYLQSCFRAFARAYPHIELHLWVDERRRTSRAADWAHLKKYALYDWLDECPYIDRVYKETYSPALFRQSVRQAQGEDYPIVVSLAMLDRHWYASLARRIGPRAFVVGQKKRVRSYDLVKHLIYRKLDAAIPAYTRDSHPDQHISAIFAGWFTHMFGMTIPAAERFPVLDIPDRWRRYAREQFDAWGFRADDTLSPARKVVFVNGFSKSVERSWPLERVIELIRAMRQDARWADAGFVVNVVPEELARARALFAGQNLADTQLFSAEDNFFQLPAVLGLCDLIISVETAVMHLANAVRVPVVALMRQKNPEWVPIDRDNSTVITVAQREDWVGAIGVEEVVRVAVTWPPAAPRS